jgi:hypothetical protein
MEINIIEIGVGVRSEAKTYPVWRRKLGSDPGFT